MKQGPQNFEQVVPADPNDLAVVDLLHRALRPHIADDSLEITIIEQMPKPDREEPAPENAF